MLTAPIATLIGALIAAIVALAIHRSTKKQPSNAESLRFLRMAFDRPAFRTPFDKEVSEDDFAQAVEDTITALNTGQLVSRRDRTTLASGWPRHNYNDKQIRSQLADVEALLQAIRREYAQAVSDRKVRVFEHNGAYFMPDRNAAVGQKIDDLRRKALEILNAVFRKVGLDELPPEIAA